MIISNRVGGGLTFVCTRIHSFVGNFLDILPIGRTFPLVTQWLRFTIAV